MGKRSIKKPPIGEKKLKGLLRPEDEALFRAAVENVEESVYVSPKISPKIKLNFPASEVVAPKRDLKPLLKGVSGDIDRRTMRALRRGQIRPEDRLDLHGMSQEDAHKSLVKFLQRSRADGKKCVIIITGRGKISQGGGLLQNQTPKWLNSSLLRQGIIAFSAAQASDGGSGAIYVLLRKPRYRLKDKFT